MTLIFLLLIALLLLLFLSGLKPRNWHFGIYISTAIWVAIAANWKRHPLQWWELLIAGVFSLLSFVSSHDDLTRAEFRAGRAGKGIEYWFERGSILWAAATAYQTVKRPKTGSAPLSSSGHLDASQKPEGQHEENRSSPQCPKCGAAMRIIRPRSRNRWKPFLGCTQFRTTGCNGSLKIIKATENIS